MLDLYRFRKSLVGTHLNSMSVNMKVTLLSGFKSFQLTVHTGRSSTLTKIFTFIQCELFIQLYANLMFFWSSRLALCSRFLQKTRIIRLSYSYFITVKEQHGILTKNGQIFSLPHFHFKFKSVNISTILTSKLIACVYVWRLVFWLSLGIYFLS